MYAQKQRKQFSYFKTREMAQNNDLVKTSERLASHKPNASDETTFLTVLAICIVVCWENVPWFFAFISFWMKCLQLPSGFPIAMDWFKIMCQTQIRGPDGHIYMWVQAHVRSAHVCLESLEWSSSIRLKLNFNTSFC